jgi:hypothetical protein
VICVPATLIVPLRAGPVSAATVKVMPPFPLPAVAPLSVIQGTSLDAVHPQPTGDSIVADPAPPWAPNDWASGATAKEQPADCVTVTTCPATSTVPVRAGPFVPSTAI